MTVENINIDVKTNAGAAAKQFKSLSDAMGHVNGSLHQTKSAGASAADGIQKVEKAAKKANGPLGNFSSSLKRIAFYRFIRTVLKEISQAFSEGLENAYEWSKINGGPLASSLDAVATAAAQMKNQLGAALGELIINIAPDLIQLIHIITQLATTLTRLFALLNGEKEYPVANEIAVSWKEANKAAKEYKRTILGFDEINRLNGDNGAGSTTINPADLYHMEPTGYGQGKWFDGLIDSLNGANAALGPLNDGLDSLLSKSPYQVEIGIKAGTWVRQQIDAVKVWLEELTQKNPYRIELDAQMKSGGKGVLSQVLEKLRTLKKESPVSVEVRAKTGTFDTITSKVRERVIQLRKMSPVNIVINAKKSSTFDNVLKAIKNETTEMVSDLSKLSIVIPFSLKNKDDDGKGGGGGKSIQEAIETVVIDTAAVAAAAEAAAKKKEREAANAGKSVATIAIAAGAIGALGLAAAEAGKIMGGAKGGSFGNMLADSLYASGGIIPNSGSLFVAGEAGPEIVANLGSGTGVMNVDQMQAAVSTANEGVVNAVYAMANLVVAAIDRKETDISIDGNSLARALYRPMQQENTRRGQSLVSTGAGW